MRRDNKKSDRRQRLKDRQQNNMENKGSSWNGKSYLDISGYEKILFAKIKEGSNLYDILPYIVSGDNHPQGFAQGEEDYLLDIWVHKYIGINKDSFLCLNKTYGKPCPICEENRRLYDMGDEASAKKLWPQRRTIYNINDLKSKENKDKIQIFDQAFNCFEKEMLAKLQYLSEDKEVPTVADIEEGCSVKFRGSEEKGDGFTYFTAKDFEFIDRDDGYDESIFDDVYPLDKMLVIPNYDEMSLSLFGNNIVEDFEDDEVETEQPERKVTKKRSVKRNVDTTPEPEEIETEDDANDCPLNDMTFGEDYDLDDSCDACEIRKECRTENRR